MQTPFWFIVLALIVYAVAYRGYGRWIDRTIWRADRRRTTPAHIRTDGAEYFPVRRRALWGAQFRGVAGPGPILGPLIALQFGWAPALAWIILGNVFIGWLHDHGAIMLSVRNQGRSLGGLTYEFTGAAGGLTLRGFVLFYLLTVSATFIFLISKFWNSFPGAFVATLGVLLTGVIAGQLLRRARLHIAAVTLASFALIALSFRLGTDQRLQALTQVTFGAGGEWNLPFWALVSAIVLYLAAVLPPPAVIQPVSYVAFFPAALAVLLVLGGALMTPATGVVLAQPAFVGFWGSGAGGLAGGGQPLWPILFVGIACGAVSGWHSLVGASMTARHLDAETDALPVSAGAMLFEGLLALAALAAYMVLSPDRVRQLGGDDVTAWVFGSALLTRPLLGWWGEAGMQLFFATVVVVFAITVQAQVTRFWGDVTREAFGGALLARRPAATALGLAAAVGLAWTGSWYHLWLLFGSANQLLAGLALMLMTIHLVRTRAPSGYVLVVGLFVTLTALAALAWQTVRSFLAAMGGAARTLAGALDWVPVGIGLALFALGLRMALLAIGAYRGSRPRPRRRRAALGRD